MNLLGIRILSDMGWRSTEQFAWSNGQYTFRLARIKQGASSRRRALFFVNSGNMLGLHSALL